MERDFPRLFCRGPRGALGGRERRGGRARGGRERRARTGDVGRGRGRPRGEHGLVAHGPQHGPGEAERRIRLEGVREERVDRARGARPRSAAAVASAVVAECPEANAQRRPPEEDLSEDRRVEPREAVLL